jgi:prepilin-type N-terminal cleavage/methylation domain-containing protein
MQVRQGHMRTLAPSGETGQAGFTLMEVLVAMGLATVIFAGLMTQYSAAVKTSYDQSVRVAATLQVQAILQNIGAELRVLGNGVPFDQANFQIGEDTLADPTVTEPIRVATATSTHIAFRLNESGDVHLLTQDFNPATSLQISLTDVDGVGINDPIYVSNSVMSGNDGLYGVVESVNSGAKTVTLSAGYVASPGADFVTGSVLEVVPLIAYDSPADGSGITRDSGFGPVLLGSRSTLILEYLDQNGTALGLPLTELALVEQLRAIRVTVTMPGPKKLSSGQTFTATASQIFGIRNLNYVF